VDGQTMDRRRLDYEAMTHEAWKEVRVACAFARRCCRGSRIRYCCCRLSGRYPWLQQASMAWRRKVLEAEFSQSRAELVLTAIITKYFKK
jgi:hypothetical protein